MSVQPGYNTNLVHSGAETVADVWDQATIGQSGRIEVAFCSSKGTTTARCVVGNSQVAVIPDGSAALISTKIGVDSDFLYYQSGLRPGDRIFLTIVATEAATTHVAFRSP